MHFPRFLAHPGSRASPVLPTMGPMDFRRSGKAKSADPDTRTKVAAFLSRKRIADSGLPPVWSGKRRGHLTLLVLVGLGQASAAGFGAWLFSRALLPSGTTLRGALFPVLLAAAVTVGLSGMAARVLAERLSQDYVHEIRLGLIQRNLLDDRVASLGSGVTRTTNDLTSLMNWITLGVAPLVMGIPLIVGVGVVLILLDPLLAVGLLVPVALLVPAVRILAPIAYQRARTVRTERKRLAAQVADTLQPNTAIRAGGRSEAAGSELDLQRIDWYSRSLVAASIQRAKVVGAMRGAEAATSGIATAMVIGIWLVSGLSTASIAGALTMVGLLATPIHDLGRVVEHRQTYRAAQRTIGLVTEAPRASDIERVEEAKAPSPSVAGAVAAAYLELSDGTTMPDLTARPGARVVVDAGDEDLTSEVLERFVALREGLTGEIVVGGKNLAVAGPEVFSRLVGYAARGMVPEAGTVSAAVRYRSPDSEPAEVARMLAQVGLAQRVDELPEGADTALVRGGEPLTVTEQARLLLAGAMLDDPPLLVFDHLDETLGPAGRDTMRSLLADYPGVVLLASDDPDRIVSPTHIWRPEGLHRIVEA